MLDDSPWAITPIALPACWDGEGDGDEDDEDFDDDDDEEDDLTETV